VPQWVTILGQIFSLVSKTSKFFGSKDTAIRFLKKLDAALEKSNGDTSKIEKLLDSVLDY